ncbi:MAG: hypothetical protein ACYC5H_18800 [Methylovirgula sp.]
MDVIVLAAAVARGEHEPLRQNTASMRMEEGHKLFNEVRTGGKLALPENPRRSRRGRC